MGSIPHQDKHLSDKHDVSSVTINKISYVFKNFAHMNVTVPYLLCFNAIFNFALEKRQK